MITIQAEVDDTFFEVVAKIREFKQDYPMSQLFPAASQAVRGAAYAIESQWKSYASGETLPNGERLKSPTGGYASSIKTHQESVWSYIVSSKATVARWIEDGTSKLDMKETHPYGQRGRIAKKKIPKKDGGGVRYVPYVIVPYRWATSGSGAHMAVKNVIPDQVYKFLTAKYPDKSSVFKRTVVLDGKYKSSNFWGNMESRNTYQWGSSLVGVGGDIEGLVAMDAGKDKSGRQQSSYFTFRVISADSPAGSWIKPATKALKVAEQTAEVMRPKANEKVANAIRADLGGLAK